MHMFTHFSDLRTLGRRVEATFLSRLRDEMACETVGETDDRDGRHCHYAFDARDDNRALARGREVFSRDSSNSLIDR